MRPHRYAGPRNEPGSGQCKYSYDGAGKSNDGGQSKGSGCVAGGKGIVSWLTDKQLSLVPGTVEPLRDFRAFLGSRATCGQPRGICCKTCKSGSDHGGDDHPHPAAAVQKPGQDQCGEASRHEWRPVAEDSHGGVKPEIGGLFPIFSLCGDDGFSHGLIQPKSTPDKKSAGGQQDPKQASRHWAFLAACRTFPSLTLAPTESGTRQGFLFWAHKRREMRVFAE